MPRKSLVPLTALAAFGVAIDDQGHVINLCGTWANCPHGMQRPGARISPPGRDDSGEAGMGGGYGANGALQSITAINIDQAGNGAMVVFGIAAPVAAPLIGPPVQP